jgi:ATP adenylyltransferase/5',5'''-P-1,P-4-tetraphosphate phosphorylase II
MMKDKNIISASDTLQKKVFELLEQQTREWELAAKNYKGLEKVEKHYFDFDEGVKIGVQFNSERIYSSAAKVDDKSISERKCFLCPGHLPNEQKWVEFNDNYLVLVNPFPIFPKHLTIPHRRHIDQRIMEHFPEMLNLARELDEFVVFYNGPRCGASAPDHFHFQAGNKGFMPVEQEFHQISKTLLRNENGCKAQSTENYLRHCIILEGNDKKMLSQWFQEIFELMEKLIQQEPEPMMNILCFWENEGWKIFVFPRKLHRPWQFFAEDDQKILLSPASVDMGGVLITPRREDHKKMSPSDIRDIFTQVTWEDDLFEKLVRGFSKQ